MIKELVGLAYKSRSSTNGHHLLTRLNFGDIRPVVGGEKMISGSRENNSSLKIFTVPGLYGSGPDHWQTKWEQLYGLSRIEQDNWDNPDYGRWAQQLVGQLNIESTKSELIIVAHSLGCHLLVKSFPWIKKMVRGVFLVAPPDLGAGVIKKNLSGFSIPEVTELNTEGFLVYSEDDPYASAAYSEGYGQQLGLKLINVGKRGHINSDSNLENWDEGARFLKQLLQSIRLMEPALA